MNQKKQLMVWTSALVLGVVLGLLSGRFNLGGLSALTDFVAAVYVRLFRLLAVPTIALAVVTTLAKIGSQGGAGLIFRHALAYTLLTTFAAAFVGLGLFLFIAPANLPPDVVGGADDVVGQGVGSLSYAEHVLSVVPANVVSPLLEGNVLSVLLLSAAAGVALAKMPDSDGRRALVNGLDGLQSLLFALIGALIWSLPVGIVAFAAQLAGQVGAGVVASSLGKYVAVVLVGNALQTFVVLPLFLLARGLNPLRVFGRMAPALLMALFTKSSAATLPVTMRTAERRLGVSPRVSRFVLPLCTTINMNGCAAFILVTSLFVLQNGGVALTLPTMLTWVVVAVVAAIGNAGVPMGCYFLTLSLLSGQGAPVAILGLILPIYTIIDMVETAENVWSDSCVAAMTDADLTPHLKIPNQNV